MIRGSIDIKYVFDHFITNSKWMNNTYRAACLDVGQSGHVRGQGESQHCHPPALIQPGPRRQGAAGPQAPSCSLSFSSLNLQLPPSLLRPHLPLPLPHRDQQHHPAHARPRQGRPPPAQGGEEANTRGVEGQQVLREEEEK